MKMNRLGPTAAGALAAALLLAGGALADTALTGGIVHTVSGPTITNATLLIDGGGRIVSVGGAAPAGATVVDLAGLHLFPGIVAASTTLGLVEIDAVRATVDSAEVGEITPEIQAWQAVNPDSELIPVTRANGITHAEVEPAGAPIAGYSSVIQLSGWTSEALAVQRRAALHVSWPSFRLDLTPKRRRPHDENWKSPEDQEKERDKRLRELDEYFNQADAYRKASEAHRGDPAFRVVPAWEAMLPALRGETPVFVHADETRQIRSAAAWLAKRGFRGAIVGGLDAWRCPEALGTNHVPVIYTHVFSRPGRTVDPYDVQYAAPAALQKAGVRVLFGDGQGSPSFLRNLPYTAAQAVAFGLPHDEAIKAITLYPAQLLGLGDKLGAIEAGKEASLVAVDGDLLDIRAHVRRMWIGGREVDLSSRHTRLYERYKNRPKAP